MNIKNLLSFAAVLNCAFGTPTSTVSSGGLVLPTAPATTRPYIIKRLTGNATSLFGGVFRIMVSEESSGGAFSLLSFAGPQIKQIANHNHPHILETFLGIKGKGDFWAQDAARTLKAGDFHLLGQGNDHTLALTGDDNEFTISYSPPGIEKLYQLIGTPYTGKQPFPKPNPTSGPSPPRVTGADLIALGRKYNTNFLTSWQPTNQTLVDGTTGDSVHGGSWNKAGQAIPSSTNGSYWLQPVNVKSSTSQNSTTTVTLLADGREGGIAGLVSFTSKFAKTVTYGNSVAQAVQVIKGALEVVIHTQVAGSADQREVMHPGDTLFLPDSTEYTLQAASENHKGQFYVYTNKKGSLLES